MNEIDTGSRVETRRREVEARLARIRGTMEREIGHAPSRSWWIFLLVGGAVGMALAMKGTEPPKSLPPGRPRRRLTGRRGTR